MLGKIKKFWGNPYGFPRGSSLWYIIMNKRDLSRGNMRLLLPRRARDHNDMVKNGEI
jgi:hypothetical protein